VSGALEADPRAIQGTSRRWTAWTSTRLAPAVDDTFEGDPVYIGLGTLVFIIVVLLIIYFVRRV